MLRNAPKDVGFVSTSKRNRTDCRAQMASTDCRHRGDLNAALISLLSSTRAKEKIKIKLRKL